MCQLLAMITTQVYLKNKLTHERNYMSGHKCKVRGVLIKWIPSCVKHGYTVNKKIILI